MIARLPAWCAAPARSLLLCLLLATHPAATAADYPLAPVPFNEVELTDDFWLPRLVTQREVLVPVAFERTRPGVQHLQAAADFLAGKGAPGHRAHRFIDSDLYKVIEGAAYLLQLRRDPALEARIDRIAGVIAAAQREDGYLYPSHITGVGSRRDMMGDRPYEYVVHSHELYNMGHLYEAAVAYYRATGKDDLLRVAEKNARHIHRVFFEGDPAYGDGKPVLQAPGHEEIELALVKLYRVTGEELYLEMARRFLEVRGVTYRPEGQGVMAATYAQQHAPVVEQREAVGHAVRATYLYAGMADVGTLTGNRAYAEALEAIWHDIVDTRMHITGGLGAVHGIEGFAPRFVLPNADAFNETCAAVGNVFFNFRMFLLTKDAKYLDVAEVALLNNALAGVNLAGDRFFYVNPLAADGERPFNHGTPGRAPWFGTACCPTNLARLIPQVPGMMYAHDEDSLYCAFYAGSKTRVTMHGVDVDVRQTTSYPNDGTISIELAPAEPVPFQLRLRIPTWTRDQFVPGELYRFVDDVVEGVTIELNGDPVEPERERGFAVIDRQWRAGDRVELRLPMPVRVSSCRPEVAANRGRVALTRGPFVLCAEGIDNDGSLERFVLDPLPDPTKTTLSTVDLGERASFVRLGIPASFIDDTGRAERTELRLVPYYAWNNRGVGPMAVWFRRQRELGYEIRVDTISSGFDKKTCWVHPRAGTIPAPSAGADPIVVLTMQKLLLTGSDVFYALNEMRTDDLGKTWVGPTEHAATLGRRNEPNGVVVATCDLTPQWHAQSEKLLGIGQTVRYRNNRVMAVRSREISYSVYDQEKRTWIPWTTVKLPDRPAFANAGAGSAQRFDLPDGDILLPIYFKEPAKKQYSVTVLRCSFDGATLAYLEHGSEHTVPVERGLAEPSITRFGDRYFLTLRNDVKAYVTSGVDGLHFEEPRPWRFDDGRELGSYNTQQHWVTHSDGLFLTYTRRGANNDHVFRHRAPLFIARVDPARLCVLRSTERILVEERGARLGNFAVTNVSPGETWVTVAEWMQTRGPNPYDFRVPMKYGADNCVFAARLRWKAPNRLLTSE